jgi:hypothetical protein
MEGDSEPTPKRHKAQHDPQKTPRATRSHVGKGFPAPEATGSVLETPSEAQSQSTTSQASGRSSPSKQLASLELSSSGLETRQLTINDAQLPSDLLSILEGLQDIKNSGLGIISEVWKDRIRDMAKTDREMARIRDHMFGAPQTRDKYGPTPCPFDVQTLATEAADCQEAKQNEAGWNMMVHYPLLFQAVYGAQRNRQLLGVTPCTTAKVIREYLPVAWQAKMVDFCIFIDSSDHIEEIQDARRILPSGYINHTDLYGLRNHPIALSIETKAASGTAAASAELQIGTWQSAQWRFLEDLVARNGGCIDDLPFLPAIIVQGHQWSFAATTRDAKKTVLWLPFHFGSTEDVIGIYKTVLGLQQICYWVNETFWPWYKKNALGIKV